MMNSGSKQEQETGILQTSHSIKAAHEAYKQANVPIPVVRSGLIRISPIKTHPDMPAVLDEFHRMNISASREDKGLIVTKCDGCYRSDCPDCVAIFQSCLLYTSPSPRDRQKSRMPSSA